MDDDLIIPDFSEDEEPATEVAAEQAQNRAFLIGAAVLAGVFVLGLCVALFIILRPQAGGAIELTRQYIEQANAANQTFAAETAIAAQFTATPTTAEEVGATPEETIVAEVTVTQTPLLAVTQTEATAAAGELATLSETQIAEGTTTPFATVKPTETTAPPLEVTQLGGLPTPTRIVSGVDGAGGGVVPTSTALPSAGIGSGTGLAGIGLLALVLVAVVFVARRLRLS